MTDPATPHSPPSVHRAGSQPEPAAGETGPVAAWNRGGPAPAGDGNLLAARDGGPVPVQASATGLPGPQDLPVHFPYLVEQLRAEEELRNSLDRLRVFMNALADPAWVKFPRGVYLACNRPFESFFGTREEALVGHTDHDFVDPGLADSFREHDRMAIAAGGPVTREDEMTFAGDGRKELLETTKTPLFNSSGTLLGVLGIGRSITRRARAEAAAKLQNERHQAMLRTTRDGIWLVDADGRFLEVNDTACHLLGRTREELFGASIGLVEAGESAEDLARREPGRMVHCAVAPGVQAKGDPELMAIALGNLVGNAWKYTARTPGAAIEFGTEDQAGERIFYVRDNGAGFDMQYAKRLFSPFQRMHRPDEFEGTGIGLAIASRVIQRHGGSIRAEARVGRGATFRFTLPGHKVPGAQAPRADPPLPAGS